MQEPFMFDDDLDSLLERHPPRTVELFHRLLAIVREIRPDFTFKVSTGWQTVNFHLPRHGFILALYASREGRVLLIFQDGRLLDSPLHDDDGKFKKVRWIVLTPGRKLPVDDIAILIAEAVALRS
jgi:hypothetical protein